MHVRTWMASSCAVLAMAAGLACNGKTSSPVAPDDPFAGSPPSGVTSNSPPTITALSATPPSILLGENSTLRATVSDTDGDSITCTWSLDDGDGSLDDGDGSLDARDNGCTAELRPARTGTLRATVVARDARGASSASRSVDVAVGRDSRPAPPPQPGPIGGPAPNPNPNPNPGPTPTPSPTPSPSPTPVPTPSPAPTPQPTPSPGANRPPIVTISATPSSCVAPCTVTVRASAYDPDDDRVVSLTFGGCASGTFAASTAETTCQLLNFAEVVAYVTARDTLGASATASVVIEGQGSTNHAPSVTLRSSGDSCHPRPGSPCRLTLVAQASDSDPGDSLTYEWSGCASGARDTAECVVDDLGDHEGRVIVRDRAGASAGATVRVRGVNRAPDGQAVAGRGCHPFPVACSAGVQANGSDPDGDTLTFTWRGCASGDGTGATCTLPERSATAQTAIVTISDGWTSIERSVAVTPLNEAPNVTASGGGSCHPRPGQPCSVQVTANASDPDGDPVSYTWFDCAAGSARQATCTVETLSAHNATVTVRDPFGAQRLASVTSFGVNQAAHASASPRQGGGASATYTLGWSDGDGDGVTCELASPSDGRCVWRGCSPGGSPSGTTQCQLDVVARPTDRITCDLRLICEDVWGQGQEVTFTHVFQQ